MAPARIFWTRWVDVYKATRGRLQAHNAFNAPPSKPLRSCNSLLWHASPPSVRYLRSSFCRHLMEVVLRFAFILAMSRFVDHKFVSNEYSLIITQAQHKQHKHNTSNTSTPQCKHNASTTQATHWKHATTQTGDLESVTGDLESVTDGPL